MTTRRKAWATTVNLFFAGLVAAAIVIYNDRSFYLLAGVILMTRVGFDSDPTTKEAMAYSIARRLKVNRTIAQESILPMSLLFAWPLWLLVSIVALWRDE